MAILNKVRTALRLRCSRYRVQLAALPPNLEAYWRSSAPHEYQGIPTDAFFFVRAAEGLMNFFDAVTSSRTRCALPSVAADSVWHAWLRRDPLGLDKFCRTHFGRTVPHVEHSDLGTDALQNTLAACRKVEDVAPDRMHLPSLFSLDARLRMPGGHGYWFHGSDIVWARLGKTGLPLGRAQPHPELTKAALIAAGIVNEQAYAAYAAARQRQGDDASFVLFDGGGGCADGAGDSGSGCGSSCGSGCGGGCGGGD
jgi:hypothetical protein